VVCDKLASAPFQEEVAFIGFAAVVTIRRVAINRISTSREIGRELALIANKTIMTKSTRGARKKRRGSHVMMLA
jgi:hypothetical protein